MRQRLLHLSLISTLCLSLIITYLPMSSANALSAADWKAGRIIDDAIFFNKNSMDVAQIQQFLNAKVPVCDTNHNASFWLYGYWNAPPYTCIKDYQENGKSAAQIIWDAAQTYSINPQVLIVILQKETGLITDTWAAPWQYKRAVGYRCPDSKLGTDVDANQNGCYDDYENFTAQINGAAYRLRDYVNRPDSYNFKAGVTRNIQWDVGCSSSPVYIETQGTAALYNYTPYQPNATALSNLYGSQDDGCSSYGNRNFWVYFTNWFGSTIGSLLRTVDSPNLYLSDGTYRYIVPSMSIVEQYGYTLASVRYVAQSELDSTPLASSPLSTTLGLVVKSPDDFDDDGGAVYLISEGKRFPISSIDQFINFGFTSQSLTYLSLDALKAIPLSTSNLSDFVKSPDSSVFKIENGKKRAIFELSKLAQLNPQGSITPLSFATLSYLPYGPPIVDGDFVVIGENGAIRLYSSTSDFYTLPNMDIYGCLGLDRVKTFRVLSFDTTGGSSSGAASCFVKDSSINYIMSKNKKYVLTDTPSGITFQNLSPSILSSATTSSLQPVLKGSGDALYVLENGNLRAIPTMGIYTSLGYGSTSITQLPDSVMRALSRGGDKLSIGTIGLHPNGAVSIVTGVNERYQIASIRQFNDFSFKWSGSVYITSQTELSYPPAGTLSNFVKSAGLLYLVDAGVRYLVDPSLDVSFGLERSTVPSIDRSILNNTLSWNLSRFIKSRSSDSVYYMEDGKKRPIASWQRVIELGGANDIVILSDAKVNSIPTGSKI